MNDLQQLTRKAIEVRRDILKMINHGKGGHIGGAFSSVEILVVLYHKLMRNDPNNPNWEERDRFILSKGHSVEGYYAVLAQKGYFSRAELETYRDFGSKFIGHPSNQVPGVEVNTGALGHGLSIAVGMAIAGKMDQKDYKVYTLMGDGELAEGSVWEAAMAGGHYQLDNLVAIIDRNRLQITGDTDSVIKLESLKAKWLAFDWEVMEVDGHDCEELIKCFEAIPTTNKPHLVIANTIKGKGISFMENKREWHHKVPSQAEFDQALAELESKMEVVKE